MIGVTVEVATLAALGTRTDITDDLAAADLAVKLNEEGTGGFVVPNGVTLPSDPIGKAVIVSAGGTDAGSFVVEGKVARTVDPGEEARMVTEYYGRGLGSLLDRYRVHPTLGPERQPWALTRTFSAFSPEYDDTAWGTATEYGTLLDDTDFWNGKPSGFPAFDVDRIGPVEGTDAAAPQGYWWTRKSFTLATAMLVRFFVASDNAADVYIDGFQLGRISSDGVDTRSFTQAVEYTLYLDAGTHVVGAKVVNIPLGGGDPGYGEGPELTGNPTFFMLAGYEATGDGELLSRVVATDATWKLLAYPTTPPGLTDAEVVEILVDENVAAGVTPTFTVNPVGTFDPVETITVDVGQSLLEHIKDRADGSWLDWSVPPAALTLNLYPSGDLGTASGVTFSTANENLLRLQATQLDVDTTGLWVTYVGGHTFVGTHGKDANLRTRAATIGEAKALAEAILARDPQPEQVTVDVAPLTGQIPGVDIVAGDTVTAGTYTERVIGWSMSWSDDPLNGEPRFDLELKNRIRDDDERFRLMVQRAAPGQLGGSAPASPAADPPEFASTAQQRDFEFSIQGADGAVVAEVKPMVKSPTTSTNVYAFDVATSGLTGTLGVRLLLDGVDIGEGSVTTATKTIPTDAIEWATAGVSLLSVQITAAPTSVDSITITPRTL